MKTELDVTIKANIEVTAMYNNKQGHVVFRIGDATDLYDEDDLTELPTGNLQKFLMKMVAARKAVQFKVDKEWF